jgi:CheY-like chemotaxis protein
MRREDTDRMTIIALTANAFKEDVDKAIASGMNAHLAKPVDMNQLLQALYRFL